MYIIGMQVHRHIYDVHNKKGVYTMEKKRMTPREKLDLMKEINERNEQRRQEFIDEQRKQKRNEKLFDMYVKGMISREVFENKFQK